jgi:hypothetical protein
MPMMSPPYKNPQGMYERLHNKIYVYNKGDLQALPQTIIDRLIQEVLDDMKREGVNK